jgi:hypothetical protein
MAQGKSTRKIQVKVVFKQLNTQAKIGYFDRTFEGASADTKSATFLKVVRDLQSRACMETVGRQYSRTRFNKFCEDNGSLVYDYSNGYKHGASPKKKPQYKELIEANNLGISVEITNNY